MFQHERRRRPVCPRPAASSSKIRKVKSMKIEVKPVVIFTLEEVKALQIIANIGCEGLRCSQCPFNINTDTSSCVKTIIRQIYNKYLSERVVSK